MKKFLAILLIAIVACEAIQDLELESWKNDIWEKIKQVIKKKEGEKARIDFIKNKIMQIGKDAAIDLCTKYYQREICVEEIEKILKS